MPAISASEMQAYVEAENHRKVVGLIEMALGHALPDLKIDMPGATYHGVALEIVAAIKSRPREERFVLLPLISARVSPVASSADAAPDAGVKGRSAIAPSKPESGSTLSRGA
jgi:hypothetical protein